MKGETDTYDVVVIAKGYPESQFPAHRALLSARSPWFRNILAEMAGSDDPGAAVIVPDVTPAMLHVAIGYLYRDELVLPSVELPTARSPPSSTLACPGWPFLYDYTRRGSSMLMILFL